MERFQNQNRMQMPSFYGVEGTIVEMRTADSAGMGNRTGCSMFVSVEDENGNIVNFIVSPSTYVADFITLREGMEAVFYYRTDSPVPLIYPPQYSAAVVVPKQLLRGQSVTVGHFKDSLVNEEQTLQLHMDGSVQVLTTNNQRFLGSPGGRDLVVFYERSTRSIPAQTTPEKIVVLCGR